MNVRPVSVRTRAVLLTVIAGLVLSSGCGGGSDGSAPPTGSYIEPTIVGLQDNFTGKVIPMPPNGVAETPIAIPCNCIFPLTSISYHATLVVQSGQAPFTFTMSGNTVTFDDNPNPPVTVDGLTFDSKTGALEMYAPATCGQLNGKGMLVLSAVDKRGNKTTPGMSIPFTIVHLVL